MSHFVFGEFDAQNLSEQIIRNAKKELQNVGLIIHFNQELAEYHNVSEMLIENGDNYCNTFCITSYKQECNSDDVLFPYDKYSDSELFPNKTDRTVFNKICEANISILKEAISKIEKLLLIKRIRIFVVEGYDINFTVLRCSLEDMIENILVQVKTSFSLNSSIYEIK